MVHLYYRRRDLILIPSWTVIQGMANIWNSASIPAIRRAEGDDRATRKTRKVTTIYDTETPVKGMQVYMIHIHMTLTFFSFLFYALYPEPQKTRPIVHAHFYS
jgi:hypothetical protein